MNTKNIILGIDFGETIESHDANRVKVENPRALEVIARCVKECGKVYIISKVNPTQMVDVVVWMRDHDFIKKTGILPENIRFCAGRQDKAPIAESLGITHMIDDRPEVMAFMPPEINKILFNPLSGDVVRWGQQKTMIVNSWTEIENFIFGET